MNEYLFLNIKNLCECCYDNTNTKHGRKADEKEKELMQHKKIKKVVDKLNLPGCIFDIKSVIDWFEECFNTIQTENINYDSMLDYLDKEFDDFNNLYLPDEEEIQIVMN